MIVHSISSYEKLSGVVSGVAHAPDFKLWFSVPYEIENCGDPFLVSLLPTAMKNGDDLEIIDAPVSSYLIQQIDQIQNIWSRWFGYKPIRVTVKKTREDRPSSSNIGCFFTGGVDSFYSLLKNLKGERKPTHLLFAHGFDIPLTDGVRYDMVKSRISSIAKTLDLVPVFPSSNIRQFTDGNCDWGLLQHGSALAGLALCMQNIFKTILIPATHIYSDELPWGSHPLIDPLWSTETLSFIHDGCEATRVQKILREISRSDIALANLRVCWRTNKEYNCGKCEKCLRTMLNLIAAGCLERCSTFPNGVNEEDISIVLKNVDESTIAFAKENLDALYRVGARPDIQRALKSIITKHDSKRNLKDRIKKIDSQLFGGYFRRRFRNH